MGVRFGVGLLGNRLVGLRWSGFGIGLKLRFGNRLNFGSSLVEVASEEEEDDESAKNNRKHRNWNDRIH